MTAGLAQIKEMPLVGRDVLVERMLRRVLDSRSAFVLVGSPGVGKSRLASEVAKAAEGHGFVTPRIAATRSAASIPFAAFAPLMPDIVEFPGALVGVLRKASDAILERAGSRGHLLMVVDDAHLLDDGSAALVHQLAQERTCSLVATVRAAASPPDPIVALWKDDLAERLDVDALAYGEVEELVTAMLGGPMAGAGLRWLWESTAGNPLYLRELMAGAIQSGALHDEGGVWTLRRPLPAPRRLAELVASRLADLPADTAEVVDVVALGEPLPLEVLAAMVPAPALEDAERRGVIVVDDPGGLPLASMDHPIYGEVRRHEIPPIRMRRLCGGLAAAMAGRAHPQQGDELRIARWRVEAGLPGDPALLGRAAMTARRMFDMELATRLAKASLEAGGGIEAGLALGEADFFSGRPEEAERVLGALVPVCADDEEISRVANARAYNLGVMLGDRDAAAAVVATALAAVSDPSARYRLLNRRATVDVFADRAADALADAEELMTSGRDVFFARGAFVAGFALAMLGRADEAVRITLQGMEAHVRSGDQSRLPEAHLIGAIVGHLGAGRLAAADDAARRGYDVNARLNAQEGVATFALLRGLVGIETGRLHDAGRLFREAAAANRELRDTPALRWSVGGVALAAAMAGDASTPLGALEELDGIGTHWMTALDHDTVDRARAWAAAAAGEPRAALLRLGETAARARAQQRRYAEARLLHDVARIGSPAEVVDRLHELAGEVDGGMVAAFAAHAGALVDGGGEGLERAGARFEALGALLIAAEALDAASRAYAGEGLQRPANAAIRRAAGLRERCGLAAGGPAGPLVVRAGGSARLTGREREVAVLAASGLRSKEIGERLFISARTVENHLANVYLKLGVTSRDDLPGALDPR